MALLPLGATEPHNLHLPYGTDTFQVEVIAAGPVPIATQAGARVLQLPACPYGTETNQMKFPLAMNLNPTTMLRRDLRSRGVAGDARNLTVRALERTRGQRSEMGFARAPLSNAGPSFSLQLV